MSHSNTDAIYRPHRKTKFLRGLLADLRRALLGGLFLLPICSAPCLRAEQIVLEPASKLWLVGDSTLHAYTSTASTFTLTMKTEPASPSTVNDLYADIESGKMTALDVAVVVKSLKSGKNQLDRNMVKALKADQYPDITFHMQSYAVAPSTTPKTFSLTAKGDLSVAGQTKPIELNAVVRQENGVKITGHKDLLMTDYGVKPPTIMGAIKTRDRVVINFDLILNKK